MTKDREFCHFCGTELDDSDESMTPYGYRVCNECVDSMNDAEQETLLSRESLEAL